MTATNLATDRLFYLRERHELTRLLAQLGDDPIQGPQLRERLDDVEFELSQIPVERVRDFVLTPQAVDVSTAELKERIRELEVEVGSLKSRFSPVRAGSEKGLAQPRWEWATIIDRLRYAVIPGVVVTSAILLIIGHILLASIDQSLVNSYLLIAVVLVYVLYTKFPGNFQTAHHR